MEIELGQQHSHSHSVSGADSIKSYFFHPVLNITENPPAALSGEGSHRWMRISDESPGLGRKYLRQLAL